MRRLRVVDLATSWRAFGGRPWDLSIRSAYNDREQASRTPLRWVDAFRSSRSVTPSTFMVETHSTSGILAGSMSPRRLWICGETGNDDWVPYHARRHICPMLLCAWEYLILFGNLLAISDSENYWDCALGNLKHLQAADIYVRNSVSILEWTQKQGIHPPKHPP